jgi:hypothetical protein
MTSSLSAPSRTRLEQCQHSAARIHPNRAGTVQTSNAPDGKSEALELGHRNLWKDSTMLANNLKVKYCARAPNVTGAEIGRLLLRSAR